jgi:hypothetical protein
VRTPCARTNDEHAGAELLKSKLVVTGWEQAIGVEVREHLPLFKAWMATGGHESNMS